MTALIITSSVLSYIMVGLWVFGYTAGRDGRGEITTHNDGSIYGLWYYRDEADQILAGIFWPVVLLFWVLKPIPHLGYRRGVKSMKSRRIRIELEKKIRVETDRAEKEALAEVEAMLSHRITYPSSKEAA